MAEHELEAVLGRILESARELTGARYAALGVLGESRRELEQFITAGIDQAAHRAIGHLPRGRGVLGVLIDDPRPLRLKDVTRHPQSYGFPAAHPEMRRFLGVPIIIRGEPWGNLYLTEKDTGSEFTDEDEEAVIVLADWAATAIDNARLYGSSERRREELERAVRSFDAARDIIDAISGSASLELVLELIVKRGRALVDARTALIMLREGDELVVQASAGFAIDARGHRLPLSRSTSGQVLRSGRSQRVDAPSEMLVAPVNLGVPEASCALLVPMVHRGMGLGVLAAFDHGPEAGAFTASEEALLRTFAASAATAVAINRSVEAERLRGTIEAADAERARWARELHDETLQSLGAVRVALASSLGRQDAAGREETIRQAIDDIEVEIGNLRAIISDLRPSMLDDLGLLPAIEALLVRRRAAGLEISSELAIPERTSSAGDGLPAELETTVYRVIQEALTNVSKHARADSARVAVRLEGGAVRIEVADDGVGFDPGTRTNGFGLAGMRERVYLAGGTLEIKPQETGTCLRASLPIRPPPAAAWADLG